MSKKNQVTGRVGEDVAQAHASAQPGESWATRYRFDMDANRVVPVENETLPVHVQRIQVEQTKDGFIATMPTLAYAAFPMMDPYSQNNNIYDYDNFSAWDRVSNLGDGKADIRKAIRYYKNDPVAYKCVSLLAQLANSTMTISCANAQFSDIVDNWRKIAMPHSFMQAWFTEYFKTSFVTSLKTLIPYIPREYKSNKIPSTDEDGSVVTQAVGAQEAEDAARDAKSQELVEKNFKRLQDFKCAVAVYEQAKVMNNQGLCTQERLEIYHKAMANAQYEWLQGTLPGAYTILDPQLVDIDGPAEMSLLRQPFLNVSGELTNAVATPTEYNRDVIASLPLEMITQLRNGALKLWLSPNICNITFGDKAPYERYPTPVMKRAFAALDLKAEMLEMDRATVRSVKNRILLVKLGTDALPEYDFAKIKAVQAMFATPSRSMTLVWNHAIELEWIQPDLSSLTDDKKYKSINAEIRMPFGVGEVLTGTSEASGSVSVLNFKGVEEVVDEAQAKFLEFFQKEVKMVRAALGVSADVKAEFDKLNLKDEIKFWAVLTQAVINGLIDPQTALETLHFHFPTILQRMKDFKKFKAQGLFVPSPSANNLGPGGQLLPQKGGIPSGPQGGKPAASPLADNNANRKGQPSKTKIKAAARIMPVDDQNVAMVLDIDQIEPDMVEDLVGMFGCDPDWIMTKATYQAKYGDISFSKPWPELSGAEAMYCVKDVTRLNSKIDKEIEASAAQWSAANASKGSGKRGSYLTDKVKDELAEAALKKVLVDYLPSATGEDETAIAANLKSTIASLQLTDPELSDRDVRVSAAALCKKRYEKSKAVAA